MTYELTAAHISQDMFLYFYTRPYCRITPYLIGIYLFWAYENKLQLPSSTTLKYFLSFLPLLVIIFTIIYFEILPTPTTLESLPFILLHRPIFVFGTAVFLYSLLLQPSTQHPFLTSKFFLILSRFTYGIYMIHSFFICYFILAYDEGYYFTPALSMVPTKGALAEGFPVKYSSVYNHVSCKTNFKLTDGQNEGWCAKDIKSGDWVQIDAPHEVVWKSIETKGRYNQFVKTYKLTYSNDGITWKDFEGGTFIGNSDASSSKVNMINPGIKAKMIRIVVLAYQHRASMRFEAYFTEVPTKEATKGALAEGFPVKYSSVYNHVSCKTNFKLTDGQNEGWCAKDIKSGDWVQIDAPHEVVWKSIETKGRYNQFVKTYKLTYSNDGITWKDFEGGTFIGNSDASSSKVNMINPGIKAKMIRIVVLAYQHRASMRFEAYFTEVPTKEATKGALAEGFPVKYSSVYNHVSCKTNFKLTDGQNEGWCAKDIKSGDWVQIDAPHEVVWKSIETKGRYNQFVKTYKLTYSNDGITWKDFEGGTFIGNSDASSSKVNMINPGIKAKMIRIVVLAYQHRASMRFEAYFTEVPTKEATKGALAEGFPVKYSSVYNHVSCKTNFKLTDGQNEGWCAKDIKSGDWVQIDAPHEVVWKSIETKGRYNQFVKTYKLTYSNDGITWKDFEGGTFIGNSDASSSKVNMINPGIKAKMIRIVVLAYQHRASMRFEAYFTDAQTKYRTGNYYLLLSTTILLFFTSNLNI